MMRFKKASIELSVNFLVTFIITIVVFGLGIILAKQIFSGSEGLADKTFEDLDKQIGSLVCSGNEKVCLSAKQRTIERGAFGVFGLTIQNVFNEEKIFIITVTQGTYVNPGQEVEDVDVEMGILPLERELTLAAKESDSMGIGIEVPENAPSGTYAFDVNVVFESDEHDVDVTNPAYSPTRKIYVKVP